MATELRPLVVINKKKDKETACTFKNTRIWRQVFHCKVSRELSRGANERIARRFSLSFRLFFASFI